MSSSFRWHLNYKYLNTNWNNICLINENYSTNVGLYCFGRHFCQCIRSLGITPSVAQFSVCLLSWINVPTALTNGVKLIFIQLIGFWLVVYIECRDYIFWHVFVIVLQVLYFFELFLCFFEPNPTAATGTTIVWSFKNRKNTVAFAKLYCITYRILTWSIFRSYVWNM